MVCCSALYFTGVLFYYVFWQVTIWWLCHIIAMFWGLWFPFQAHKFDATGKTKYLHLAAILSALFLPGIPIVIALSTGGYDYLNFPPANCGGVHPDGLFYGLIFPFATMIIVGLSLLLLIFWIICKVRHDLAWFIK